MNEGIVNLFWCQSYDEFAICSVTCLSKPIFPRLVVSGCKKNGCSVYKTVKMETTTVQFNTPCTDSLAIDIPSKCKTPTKGKLRLNTKATVFENQFFTGLFSK